MLSPNPVGASIFIYFFFFFLKHAVYVLNLLLSFAEQVKGTIIGFLPLKEPSQDVEGPLLTLPPWKLRPLIFIDLHRLLQHRQEPVSQSACGAGKCEHLVETGNLFFPTYGRHISVYYRLQDFHPLCQVLSVDELQRKVVLWKETRNQSFTPVSPDIKMCVKEGELKINKQ